MDTFVAKHLAGVSRTYAILIPMLPAELERAVGLAYLVMRVVDTLEDTPDLPAATRLRLLDSFQTALHADRLCLDDEFTRGLGETPAERDLLRDVPELLEHLRRLEPAYREAVRTCAGRMMDGLRRFLARSDERGRAYPAIRDAEELRSYCYYVAGVVGEMLCDMMAYHLDFAPLRKLREVAVELGIGLQLVNILKDALQDAQRGRRYLPTTEGDEVSHAQVYKAVLQEARLSLQRGTEFVLALPAKAPSLRSFCGLPIAWGALTLARAERDARRAKIGRATVRASTERFQRLAGDDRALRRWLEHLLCRPAAGQTA